MDTWLIIAIGAAAAAALLLIAALGRSVKRRRSAKQTSELREGFGPEYATAVGEHGRSGAEEDLLKRKQRADLFQVRTLSAVEVAHYTESWAAMQAKFVDDPGATLTGAGRLLVEVLTARGYPAADFEQGASALSVDHPRAVQDYRAAHEVALRNQRNPVPTDDLRAAMVQYHAVFTELMDSGPAAPAVHAP